MPTATVIFREKKLEWLKSSLFLLTAASHRRDSTLCHMAWALQQGLHLSQILPFGDSQATGNMITCIFFFDRFIHRPKAVIICKHLQGNNQDTLEQLLPNPPPCSHSDVLNQHTIPLNSCFSRSLKPKQTLNFPFFPPSFIYSLFLFVHFCASPVDVKDLSISPAQPIPAIHFSPESLFCKLTDVL